MLDGRKVSLLAAAASMSLVPLVATILDSSRVGTGAPEVRTSTSRVASVPICPLEPLDARLADSGWAAGGVAPGLFGS